MVMMPVMVMVVVRIYRDNDLGIRSRNSEDGKERNEQASQ